MFCKIYNNLLDLNCSASEKYYESCTHLMSLAGKGMAQSFEAAKRDCVLRLQECRETVEAIRVHVALHRCDR